MKVFLVCAVSFLLFLASSFFASNPAVGDVYVAGENSQAIHSFDCPLPSPATCPGVLGQPHGVTIGPDGFLYIASFATDTIVKMDPLTGACETFIDQPNGNLQSPQDLKFDEDGDLYVADFSTSRVLKYDLSGNLLQTVVHPGGGGLIGAHALSFGPQGTLFVSSANSHEVIQYNPTTGAKIRSLVPGNPADLVTPIGLAIGPDEKLYVASQNTHAILRFDPATGEDLGSFVVPGAGGLVDPRGIAFGDDGLLYVCSAATDSVFRFDACDGSFVDLFTSQNGLNNPYFLAIVPDSRIEVPTLIVNIPQDTLSAASNDPLMVKASLRNGPDAFQVVFAVLLRKPDGTMISLLPVRFSGIQPVQPSQQLDKTLSLGVAGSGCLQQIGTYVFLTRVVDSLTGELLSLSFSPFTVNL